MDNIKLAQLVYTVRHGKVVSGIVVRIVDISSMDNMLSYNIKDQISSVACSYKTVVTIQQSNSDRFERDSDAVFESKEDLIKNLI